MLAIRTANKSWTEEAPNGAHVGLVLDTTSFYAESGGQIYDTGFMTASNGGDGGDETEFSVDNVQKKGPYSLHIGTVQMGSIKVGDTLNLAIDTERRRAIMANHTVTHVLNFGLRKVIGAADQKGSLVERERMRFDFTAKKVRSSFPRPSINIRRLFTHL